MELSRLELRLNGGAGLGSKVMVAGAVGGRTLGAIIDPTALRIVQTVLASRVARQIGVPATNETYPSGVLLSTETIIVLPTKKKLGKLTRLWAERGTGQLTHVLVAMNGAEHVVDVKDIAQFTARQLTLKSGSDSNSHHPIYRDDAAMAQDIAGAIEQSLLDPRARRNVHARIEDGKVELSGLLDTDEQNAAILDAIHRVPGVRGVHSDIIVVENIAGFVANALNALEAKGDLGENPEIEVYCEHQIAYLTGRVATTKASAAAERAALNASGVRLVVNKLVVDAPTSTKRADPASPATHNR